VIEDVLFEQNIIRDTDGGLSVTGYDDLQPSGQTTRITVRNNLFITNGHFLLLGSEIGSLTLDHNTINHAYNFASAYKGDVWPAGQGRRAGTFAVATLVITNNIAKHNDYGFIGQDMGIGTASITGMTLARTFTHNVLAGELGWGFAYPTLTLRPSLAEHAAQLNADYTLALGSAYRAAGTDGKDLGRLAGAAPTTTIEPVVVEPTPTPIVVEPTPTPVIVEPTPTPVVVEPTPTPTPTLDTTGPTVTLRATQQNKKFAKYRIEASDASGIQSVRVSLNGTVIETSTVVPLDFTITLPPLAPGTYIVTATVTDKAKNTTTVTSTLNR
jgi:hypothetical protein